MRVRQSGLSPQHCVDSSASTDCQTGGILLTVMSFTKASPIPLNDHADAPADSIKGFVGRRDPIQSQSRLIVD